MKKKILYVITKSNFGGAQRYVYDLATSLPEETYDVGVILGGEGKLADMLSASGIRVMHIAGLDRDINLTKDISVFFRLLKIFKKEQPDIIHLNSSKIGGIGALAGRLAGIGNIIFTAHGWAFNEERSRPEKAAIGFLSWLTVSLSHKTIAVSQKIRSEMPVLFIPETKITTIKNGVGGIKPFTKKTAAQKIKEFTGLDEAGFLVVTVAELHRNKGLKYSIEALGTIVKTEPKIRYVILGEGGERKNLEKLITKLGLNGYVYLPGFLENAPKYLTAFNLFLLPSITEALGLSLLEAGNAGLPVIATSAGGIPEIIDDMKTGILVRPKQPRELASAVKFLLNNPDKAKDFGKNLHNKVSKEFSLEEMLEKTIALYK